MSRDFWVVFRYELRRNARRIGYLFTSFALPILLIVGLFAYQSILARDLAAQDPQEMAEAVSETFGGDLTAAGFVDFSGLIQAVPDDAADFMRRYDTVEAGEAALAAGEIQVFYIVQADYLETGRIEIVQPTFGLGQLMEQPIVSLLMDAITENVEGDRRFRLLDPSNTTFTNLQLTTLGEGSSDELEGGAFLMVYVFAITLVMSLFMTNGYMMQTVIEEKETRLVEILIATVKPGDLLGGKILAMGLLGLFQVVAWVATLFAAVALAGGSGLADTVGLIGTLANIQISPSILPVLLAYFVLAYLLFAGFYAIISAISNSMREGPQYAVIFTIPAMLPLYFIPAFTTDPNGTLPTILSLVPITAPMAMIQRLAVTSVPPLEILISLALLVVTVVAVMWLAGRIFRVGVLLAGNMPKLRDIPRLVRG
ncbi:MAG: ABC transporter permease [Anaerolineae bacterium]|nr:ABC transporter permease [Anaerolineae bacterium]